MQDEVLTPRLPHNISFGDSRQEIGKFQHQDFQEKIRFRAKNVFGNLNKKMIFRENQKATWNWVLLCQFANTGLD